MSDKATWSAFFALLAAGAGCGSSSGPAADGAADDGERIVFIRTGGAQNGPFPMGDAYVVKPDGTEERRLTTTGDLAFASYGGGRLPWR